MSRLVTSAVNNARQSAIGLARSNMERRLLSPKADDSASAPGDLSRLTREACVQLLASRRVGRFAYVESARAIDVVPVNYLSRADGAVVFRSGPGPKLSAATRRDVVAFQVDDIDESTHAGWSVLVVGRAREISPSDARSFGELPQPWATGPRHHLVLVEPTRVEGRRLI